MEKNQTNANAAGVLLCKPFEGTFENTQNESHTNAINVIMHLLGQTDTAEKSHSDATCVVIRHLKRAI